MKLEQFIAQSAADAVQQIRDRLGPDAVVVNVRQLPARWFGKPQIEVLAHVPEALPASPPAPQPVAEDRVEDAVPARKPDPTLLESLGLLPVYAAQVMEHAASPRPAWMRADLSALRAALSATWIPYQPSTVNDQPSLHVFVGAPGAGKTTVLCKWLTLEVLSRGRSARVWRLDGEAANTAEALSVYGDVLGVPVERSWSGGAFGEDIGFVDLPGGGAGMPQLPGAQVHLVLNAAYESATLVAQARAFGAALPISDVIVTHLDEEPRWGKLWNVALGTGFPVRYLSAGQNIPGEFIEATAERVLARVFPPP